MLSTLLWPNSGFFRFFSFFSFFLLPLLFLLALQLVPPGLIGEGSIKVHETKRQFTVTNHYDSSAKESWTVTALRRYGREEGKFYFEAGRRCASGEGMMYLVSDDCDEIFEKVFFVSSLGVGPDVDHPRPPARARRRRRRRRRRHRIARGSAPACVPSDGLSR